MCRFSRGLGNFLVNVPPPTGAIIGAGSDISSVIVTRSGVNLLRSGGRCCDVDVEGEVELVNLRKSFILK